MSSCLPPVHAPAHPQAAGAAAALAEDKAEVAARGRSGSAGPAACMAPEGPGDMGSMVLALGVGVG